MAVRDVLLALLAEEPAGTYQLKSSFEQRTDGAWPMNIGQVYQTMKRLVRDGLVQADEGEGRQAESFALTEAGREEVSSWWSTPVTRPVDERDELVMRLVVAARQAGLKVLDIIDEQRMCTLAEQRRLTRAGESEHLTHELLRQRRLFELEAEHRWLDHVEDALARAEEAAK